MLAVRSRPTGFEIEFTKPVDTTVAKLTSSYTVQSYYMTPSSSYGGGNKTGSKTLTPKSIQFSPDRRKVFLALDSLVPSTPTQMRVVYFKLNSYKSENNDTTWAKEAWYTLNAFGTGNPFDPPLSISAGRSQNAAASDVRWRVREGTLTLHVPTAGSYSVNLRDVQGRHLASFRGDGSQEQTFAVQGISARFAFMEVRGKGLRFASWVELR